jgi:hypothetical protein
MSGLCSTLLDKWNSLINGTLTSVKTQSWVYKLEKYNVKLYIILTQTRIILIKIKLKSLDFLLNFFLGLLPFSTDYQFCWGRQLPFAGKAHVYVAQKEMYSIMLS